MEQRGQLPQVFDREDVIAAQEEMGSTQHPGKIINDLKRAGKIVPIIGGKDFFMKCA